MLFFRIQILAPLVGLLLSTGQAQDRESFLTELDGTFTRLLEDPAGYLKLVDGEVRDLPESDLKPFTCIALGWCHRIFENPERFRAKLPLIEQALELAIVASARRVKSNETLSKLDGSHKSQLTMALAAYRLAGGNRSDLVAQEKRLIKSLAQELAEKKGAPIASYPDVTWILDTSVALFAINIHERVDGGSASQAMVAAHKKWLLDHGMDPATGLPASQLSPEGRISPGRGSDLSWTIALWRELDLAQSEKWYQTYCANYWKKVKVAQGFREWSHEQFGIIDLRSGPILAGIGGTGTVLGLCASQAHHDHATTNLIFKQGNNLAKSRRSNDLISMAISKTMDGAVKKCGIKPVKGYITGFLYGDALTFYSGSWTDYPDKPLP